MSQQKYSFFEYKTSPIENLLCEGDFLAFIIDMAIDYLPKAPPRSTLG